MDQVPSDHLGEPLRTGLWIALVAACIVIGSFAFACAAPMIAVATFAATKMRIGEAFTVVLVAWLANQLVGYLVLGYPQTWDSFGGVRRLELQRRLASSAPLVSPDWRCRQRQWPRWV